MMMGNKYMRAGCYIISAGIQGPIVDDDDLSTLPHDSSGNVPGNSNKVHIYKTPGNNFTTI